MAADNFSNKIKSFFSAIIFKMSAKWIQPLVYLNRYETVHSLSVFFFYGTIHPSLYHIVEHSWFWFDSEGCCCSSFCWIKWILSIEYSWVIPVVIVYTEIPYAFINLIAIVSYYSCHRRRLFPARRKNDTVQQHCDTPLSITLINGIATPWY